MFKIGDKVMYHKKEYIITGVCNCEGCIEREAGPAFILNNDSVHFSYVLNKVGPAIGEQLEFSFMTD